jgi:hypothetical protein
MPSTQKGGEWPFNGTYNSGTTSYNPFGYQSTTMESGMSSGVLQYVFYFIMIVIFLVLILVLVHYTIMPIFILNPGGKGIIPLPGSDDSKLYWQTPSSLAILQDTATPLGSLVENWSFMLDVQVDNPTANTDKPRILFTRGQPLVSSNSPYLSTDTILTINPSFNVCVFLDRLTNDLYISVQTKQKNGTSPSVETIIVPNIPVGKSIRLGVFVGSRVLEVYVNGYLVRSKAFPDSLVSVTGPLQPPLDTILSGTARVANLRVWKRPVSPAEFRSYGTGSDFSTVAIQDTCVSSSVSTNQDNK